MRKYAYFCFDIRWKVEFTFVKTEKLWKPDDLNIYFEASIHTIYVKFYRNENLSFDSYFAITLYKCPFLCFVGYLKSFQFSWHFGTFWALSNLVISLRRAFIKLFVPFPFSYPGFEPLRHFDKRWGVFSSSTLLKLTVPAMVQTKYILQTLQNDSYCYLKKLIVLESFAKTQVCERSIVTGTWERVLRPCWLLWRFRGAKNKKFQNPNKFVSVATLGMRFSGYQNTTCTPQTSLWTVRFCKKL